MKQPLRALLYITSLVVTITACGPGGGDTSPPKEIVFEPSTLTFSLDIATGEEVTVNLRNNFDTDTSFELVLPPLEQAAEGLLVDVDTASIPTQLSAGGSNDFLFFIGCPVIAGSYSSVIRIETSSADATLPIQVECREAPIETIISENTEVVDTQSASLLSSYDPATGRLTYSARNAFLDALEVGDVVVSAPSAAAPEGYLRKVTAVRAEGSGLILETTEASLDEVFDQAELDTVFVPSGPDDIAEIETFYDGITVSLDTTESQGLNQSQLVSPQALQLNFNFNEVLFDGDGDKTTVEDQFRVSGDLKVAPSFPTSFKVKVEWKLQCIKIFWRICTKVPSPSIYFYVGANLQENANLSVEGQVDFAQTREIPIGQVNFNPTVFFVGPVPVVITHQLRFFLDTNLTITARLSYEVQQSTRLHAGLEYNGGLRTVSGRESTFTETLDFMGNLSAAAYFRGRWESKIYGVYGPFAELRAGPRVSASLSAAQDTYAWKIEACYSGKAGTTGGFNIWFVKIGGTSFNLFDDCSLLKEGKKENPDFKNYPPVLTIEVLSHRSNEDEPLSLGDTNGVSDEDGDQYPIEVILVAENGVLSIPPQGLTFSQGDGALDASMVFQAPPSAANTALLGMIFTPQADFFGTAKITLSVIDKNGPGKAAEVGGEINVAVLEVNDPPIALDDVLENRDKGAMFTLSASVLMENDRPGPDNEEAQKLTVVAVSEPVGGTVNLEGETITFTPSPDFEGSAGFSYTVRDTGATAGEPDLKTAMARVSFSVVARPGKIIVTPQNNPIAVYVGIDSDSVSLTEPGVSVEKIVPPGSYRVWVQGGPSLAQIPDGTGKGNSISHWGPNEWFDCTYDDAKLIIVDVASGQTGSLEPPFYQIHGSIKVIYSGFSVEDLNALRGAVPAPEDDEFDNSAFCKAFGGANYLARAFEGGVMNRLETSTRNQFPGTYTLNAPSFQDCVNDYRVDFVPVTPRQTYTVEAKRLTEVTVAYAKTETEIYCGAETSETEEF